MQNNMPLWLYPLEHNVGCFEIAVDERVVRGVRQLPCLRCLQA
jgi:hypothetical protein